MSNELAPYEGKQPMVMKGGLVHWVSEETATRIQEQLQQQTAHTFMKIRELNITINTAEVEGVYTMAQYGDLCNVKQGMWQCEYRKWHNKGKRECDCKKEFFQQKEADRKRRENDAENRPQTPEERAATANYLRTMNEEAAIKGSEMWRGLFVKGNRSGHRVRRSTIDAWEAKNGSANLEGLAIEEDVQDANRAEALAILD